MSASLEWNELGEMEFEGGLFLGGKDTAAPASDAPTETNLSVVYRDEDTLACARPLCKQLFQKFGSESVRVSLWPIAALENPRVFGAVASSDIFMFAVRAEEPMPALLQSCFAAWEEPRGGGRRAVAGLYLDSGDEPRAVIPADQNLRALLKLSGQDYFSQVVARPATPRPNETAHLGGHGRDGSLSSPELMSLTNALGSHWGLDE